MEILTPALTCSFTTHDLRVNGDHRSRLSASKRLERYFQNLQNRHTSWFQFSLSDWLCPASRVINLKTMSCPRLRERIGYAAVNKTKWGSLTEPLTWFKTPVGSVTVVMRNSLVEGGFREVTMRLKKRKSFQWSNPIAQILPSYAQPDKEGVFRYVTNSSVKMVGEQKVLRLRLVKKKKRLCTKRRFVN